jgi:hypothetical protein
MSNVIKRTELSTSARVRRIVTGSIFIGIVMGTTGPLGYLTLLPLLAIYPILTGLMGEDFLDGLLANWKGGFEGECFRPSTRVALLGLGVAAIGAIMLSPENVGVRALLAIAAVYPIMAGLFGEDLISRAFGFGGKKQMAQVVERSVKAAPRSRKTVVVAGHRTATARHHWFGHHGAGPKAA